MRLVELDIQNFRGIKKATLELDELTVLIGENNSGKSSVLDALQSCLSRSLTRKAGVFSEYDYHLSDTTREPSAAPLIRITLTFKETRENEWPDEVVQAFPKAVQIDSDGLNSLIFRINSKRRHAVMEIRCISQYHMSERSLNRFEDAGHPRGLCHIPCTGGKMLC